MKTQDSFFLALLFGIGSLFSQQKQGFDLTGSIFSDSVAIEHVHIFNKASLLGTSTDTNGIFRLFVHVGDTIAISHMSFEQNLIVISESEKKTKNIVIQLAAKTHILNEIALKKKQSIFYVDPQIMPKAIAYAPTLKLPYANVTGTKKKAIVKVNLTSVSIDLDNVIGFFNGQTKKKKELQREILKDKRLAAIRKTYSDSFFVHQLKIEKEYINLFLNYCLDAGILKTDNTGNQLQLTAVLLSQSKTFPHRQSSQNIFLSKQ